MVDSQAVWVCLDNMDKFSKLHSGEIYDPADREIMEIQLKCLDRLYEFNQTRPTELDKRQALLKEMFGSIGENCYIEPPFHSNFGGRHIHFGNNVYCNFNVTMVDDTYIYIGDNTQIGPNCTIATPNHPLDSELRLKGYQQNKPVKIGKNCWLGSGVIVLPGVTIGDNVVIGAGSVVTKDIPSNVLAFGSPCKVIKKIK